MNHLNFSLVRYATSSPKEFSPIKPRLPIGECTVAEAMDKAIEYVVNEVCGYCRERSSEEYGRLIN